MSNDLWKTEILKAIDESYDGTGGVYLDSGTNTLEELQSLTGNQASIVLPGAGNSVANQVKHLLTTVAIHKPQFEGGEYPDLDWGADWEATPLSDDEWQALVTTFAATREQLKNWVQNPVVAEDSAYAGAAIMVVAHLAYHIGQIRHGIGYAKQA
ncbi:MAG: DinB family protein [Thermomicrobiales bacterium]|nr:DinB family protein [Thermomicrobiales bacterium]